jgi:hypothetical protein
MSTVDEWAKREAEREYPDAVDGSTTFRLDTERQVYMEGLLAVAALLLSDEAVEAAALSGWHPVVWSDVSEVVRESERTRARAALTAALTKITEDKE